MEEREEKVRGASSAGSWVLAALKFGDSRREIALAAVASPAARHCRNPESPPSQAVLEVATSTAEVASMPQRCSSPRPQCRICTKPGGSGSRDFHRTRSPQCLQTPRASNVCAILGFISFIELEAERSGAGERQ
eukprot:scaffold7055_cov254-Pinguiococcus_pyrenoidosus.AAC.15